MGSLSTQVVCSAQGAPQQLLKYVITSFHESICLGVKGCAKVHSAPKLDMRVFEDSLVKRGSLSKNIIAGRPWYATITLKNS